MTKTLEEFANGPPPRWMAEGWLLPNPCRPEQLTVYQRNQDPRNLFDMINPPVNPTESPELDRLNADVLEYNEAIKKQNHIKWLAGIEIARIEKSLKATLKAIETITKGPES